MRFADWSRSRERTWEGPPVSFPYATVGSGTPVKTCAPLWKAATGSLLTGSPTVANGVVYIGANTGVFYAIDEASGTALWHHPGRRVAIR